MFYVTVLKPIHVTTAPGIAPILGLPGGHLHVGPIIIPVGKGKWISNAIYVRYRDMLMRLARAGHLTIKDNSSPEGIVHPVPEPAVAEPPLTPPKPAVEVKPETAPAVVPEDKPVAVVPPVDTPQPVIDPDAKEAVAPEQVVVKKTRKKKSDTVKAPDEAGVE
jgi:hypothetical protein